MFSTGSSQNSTTSDLNGFYQSMKNLRSIDHVEDRYLLYFYVLYHYIISFRKVHKFALDYSRKKSRIWNFQDYSRDSKWIFSGDN